MMMQEHIGSSTEWKSHLTDSIAIGLVRVPPHALGQHDIRFDRTGYGSKGTSGEAAMPIRLIFAPPSRGYALDRTRASHLRSVAVSGLGYVGRSAPPLQSSYRCALHV